MTLKKLIFLMIFSLVNLGQAKAEIDPRAKAIGSMALYGTVGGALLGTAALAFDANGRAIAKGASLGLYAGLIFGSYVVISHAYKKHQRQNPQPQENYYPDTKSPYEDDDQGQGAKWNPTSELQLESLRDGYSTGPTENHRKDLSFIFPILNLSF